MSNSSKQFLFPVGILGETTSAIIPGGQTSVTGTQTFISLKEKGDGYYGSGDGMHTVTCTVGPNFEGTLTIQATLATDPIEPDWFIVNNSSVVYSSLTTLTTTTNYVNFTGNFVWVRAKVQRSNNYINNSVLAVNYNH